MKTAKRLLALLLVLLMFGGNFSVLTAYAETDEDGKAVFEQIPWGEFTLEEVLNEGQAYVYKVNASQTVTLIDTDYEQTIGKLFS